MPGQMISVATPEGDAFDAYLAMPAGGGPAPGVVLVQEIFGITPWIQKTADQFAEQGYLVAAPDMFWRRERHFVADPADAAARQKAVAHMKALDPDQAIADLAAAAAALRAREDCNGKIAVVGFCMGGTFAYLAAARLEIDAAVAYYGTQIHEYLTEGRYVTCPTIFHLGKSDTIVDTPAINAIHEALIGLPNLAIYMYEAGHAFANSDRPDAYVPEAAATAHARTFKLLDQLR